MLCSLNLPVWAQSPSALFSRPRTSARKSKSVFRMSAGATAASYKERSFHERGQESSRREQVKLSGAEAQVAFTYNNIETEVGVRQLIPQQLDSWTQRREFSLLANWRDFDIAWMQPGIGVFQVSQAGDQDAQDAQPAFVVSNRGLIFSMRASYPPMNKKKHGIMAAARVDYLTSLESRRNFGTDATATLGYFFRLGKLRLAIYGRYGRNFFNAAKPDPEDNAYELQVRHIYTAQSYGLHFEY